MRVIYIAAIVTTLLCFGAVGRAQSPPSPADVAVFDRNVFAHPEDEIYAAKCQMTYVDGQQVFAASDA